MQTLAVELLINCKNDPLADDEDEAAAGPCGRSNAQHKGHEDVWTLRIQLL